MILFSSFKRIQKSLRQKKPCFLDGYKKKRASIESDEVDSNLSEGAGELCSLDRFPTNSHKKNLPVTIFFYPMVSSITHTYFT